MFLSFLLFVERRRVRQKKSASIVEKIQNFLEAHAAVASSAWNSTVYNALVRWDKLIWFLDNGRLEIDNNLIENRIRSIALVRKNYLFAGSHAAQCAAILYSLLNTCALHGMNSAQWLVDVLKRVPAMANEARYAPLPYHWKAHKNQHSQKSRRSK